MQLLESEALTKAYKLWEGIRGPEVNSDTSPLQSMLAGVGVNKQTASGFEKSIAEKSSRLLGESLSKNTSHIIQGLYDEIGSFATNKIHKALDASEKFLTSQGIKVKRPEDLSDREWLKTMLGLIGIINPETVGKIKSLGSSLSESLNENLSERFGEEYIPKDFSQNISKKIEKTHNGIFSLIGKAFNKTREFFSSFFKPKPSNA